ncbi:probable 3-deoxy-D-manno-octulosonic acid transferase, mitochondrial isoform X2 [Punica granatum]|uniref:lipid IVA 3-deoxy-D-manno-octulosonic acid transferase n=1 Tax=Punica granatum TaxID=22663 RepID=A0A6P8DV95_PUNGR|nr:probable 3-deoxy-D-manno-octulosonic acid transferase, mitochondrial isoform X2 [Punica granatum]
MATCRGMIVYKLYRALSYGLSPLVHLHLRWRKFRGLEHPLRWPERLGRASASRPPGPLLWVHAVSLGEGMAVIPVIKQCMQQRPDFNILMTTTTLSAFEVIKDKLPTGVLYQFAPIDTPMAMDAFIGYWKPDAIILVESELWPNLILSASENGIALALINARMSAKSLRRWSGSLLLPLVSLLLSRFSLIIPLSNAQAIRFQLLQAPPFVINFSGDLKYAVGECNVSTEEVSCINDLKLQLAHKKVWMASSIHSGEEEVILAVHEYLMQKHGDMVTIIVPRYPQHGREIFQKLRKERYGVALRSQHKLLQPGTNIYIVDTLGELGQLYSLTSIAVVGGSFFPGLAGHNLSEAAAAGCAVFTGLYVGHFSHMVLQMQRVNKVSIQQVSGDLELAEALDELFTDSTALKIRQQAAKEAYHALSSGIIANTWTLIDFHVFSGLSPSNQASVQSDMKIGFLWSHAQVMRSYLGRGTRRMELPRGHPARAHTPHKPGQGAGGR